MEADVPIPEPKMSRAERAAKRKVHGRPAQRRPTPPARRPPPLRLITPCSSLALTTSRTVSARRCLALHLRILLLRAVPGNMTGGLTGGYWAARRRRRGGAAPLASAPRGRTMTKCVPHFHADPMSGIVAAQRFLHSPFFHSSVRRTRLLSSPLPRLAAAAAGAARACACALHAGLVHARPARVSDSTARVPGTRNPKLECLARPRVAGGRGGRRRVRRGR